MGGLEDKLLAERSKLKKEILRMRSEMYCKGIPVTTAGIVSLANTYFFLECIPYLTDCLRSNPREGTVASAFLLGCLSIPYYLTALSFFRLVKAWKEVKRKEEELSSLKTTGKGF